MKKMMGALVLGVALAAGSVTAAEAAPKSFTVTATLSTSNASFGNTIKVTGKVSGLNARKLKGQRVALQRKFAGGGWQKVATAKVNSKRAYAFRTRLVRGGNTSFRVVKSRSGKVRSGVSAVRTTAVYKWIDLTSASAFLYSVGFVNSPVVMGGKKYAKSFTGFSQTVVEFATAKQCTTLSTVTGFRDKDKAGADPTDKQTLQVIGVNTPTTTPINTSTTGLNDVATRSIPIGGYAVVAVVAQADYGAAILATPQVRCNLDSLPILTDEQVLL